MAFFGNTVTLVNRTSKTRQCKWDGIDYSLPPGEIPNCPIKVARAAVNQNRRLGTQDPNNPMRFESLFGIAEDKKWPTTPIEQSNAVELMDRSKLPRGAQNVRLEDLGGATYFDAMETSLDMTAEIAHAGGN